MTNETTNATPTQTRFNDTKLLLAGGAGFLTLAATFLWRDLALPAEAVLLVSACLAAVTSLFGFPRRVPLVGPVAVLVTAAVGGAWFLVTRNPLLLPAHGIGLGAAIAAIVRLERADQWPASSLPGRLVWYGAGLSFLVATWAFYFHFLTAGVASASVGRRLVPTIIWLAVGLALFVAGRVRARAAMQTGAGLMGIALVKAVSYDTTHLHGLLRVGVLGAVGTLLLAGGVGLRRLADARPEEVVS
jgi:hypothetical protein